MKIPVYTAINIETEMPSGSTHPMIFEVMDAEAFVKDRYVVKISSLQRIEREHPANKEFYAYALTKAFDLKIPDAALIFISNNLVNELKKKTFFRKFDIEEGYYFGSKYLTNIVDYGMVNLHENFEIWQLADIFAFDALIRNMDRRVNNPNIFVVGEKEDEFCLIDHELSLRVLPDCLTVIETEKQWNFLRWNAVNPGGQHIFYERLKAEVNQAGFIAFNEFELSLDNLSPTNIIKPIADFLEEYGIDSSDSVDIIAYLNCIKQHKKQFIDRLKQLLQ